MTKTYFFLQLHFTLRLVVIQFERSMSNLMLTKIVALNTIIDNYKNKFGDEHYERMKSLMENLYIDVLKHIDSFDWIGH